jgi:hypothetical protein
MGRTAAARLTVLGYCRQLWLTANGRGSAASAPTLLPPRCGIHTFSAPYFTGEMMPTTTQPMPLALLRMGLWSGVVLFGVVIWILHRQPGWTPHTMAMPVKYVQALMSVLAVAIALAMRGRTNRETNDAQRNSRLLTLWAVGEAPALLGGVIFFVTGEPQSYVLGLFAMLTTLMLLPIARPG